MLDTPIFPMYICTWDQVSDTTWCNSLSGILHTLKSPIEYGYRILKLDGIVCWKCQAPFLTSHLLSARTGQPLLVKKTVSKRGRKGVTGQKRSLQMSANYPLSFGLAVANLIAPTGVPHQQPELGSYKFTLKIYIYIDLLSNFLQLQLPTPLPEEIRIGDDDPDFFDDGAIDDLIKGRTFAAWRRLWWHMWRT